MRRGGLVAALVLCAVVRPAPAAAHRLDEYLQATQIAVGVHAIGVEIDLSPGVAVADEVIRAIDTDSDGQFDRHETETYATAVLRALTLSVDDRPASLRLDQRVFPIPADLREGVGTIRLVASAPIAPATGRRRLQFANAFVPGISVYQVNALVPADMRVVVAGQHRDPLQRSFILDYDVAGSRGWIGWSAAALAMIAGLVAVRSRADLRMFTGWRLRRVEAVR